MTLQDLNLFLHDIKNQNKPVPSQSLELRGDFLIPPAGENRIKPLRTSEPHPGTFCAASAARFPPQRWAEAEPTEERAQAVVHQVVQIKHAQMRHQLGQLDQKREHEATEHAASQLSPLISIASAYSQKFFRLSLQNACKALL